MRIDEMVTLIRTIDLIVMLGIKPTRHAIAKNIKSVSRSTVYRRINKMCEMGLLEFVKRDSDAMLVMVTKHGCDIMDASRRLWM